MTPGRLFTLVMILKQAPFSSVLGGERDSKPKGPFSRLAILYKNKRFTPLSLAVKNLRTSLECKNKAFNSPGTQHGCHAKKVYTFH